MSIGRSMKREVRVALSPRAQPWWFRLLKWVVIVTLSVRYWRHPSFWWWAAGALALALTVHFIWRWKTDGWTRPWGGWNDVEAARRD
jgi:hypothetical protein